MPIWTLHNLTLHGTNRSRLDGVSLQIGDGVTAVVGFSGAGKSSLLSVLAGMERPDAGTVEYDRPLRPSNHARGNATAVEAHRTEAETGSESHRTERLTHRLPLFWSPETGGLWPHLTAREHLTAVGEHSTLSTLDPGLSAPRDSADKLLADFDLTDRQHALPGQLSQGEQSRLAIARALAADATVLLFDEPLAHVDPARRPKYWDVIRQHIQLRETSLVFATHEPEIVLREARDVICLDEGRVMYRGAVRELYDNPPDERSASFLGPVNWFDPEDIADWLGLSEAKPRTLVNQGCVRPERLELIDDCDSPIEVVSSHFCGSYAETRLRHGDGRKRTVIHRPAAAVLAAAQRVRIQIRREQASE